MPGAPRGGWEGPAHGCGAGDSVGGGAVSARMTWRKNPRPSGLAGVCCGPQGSSLRKAGHIIAQTAALCRGLNREIIGWYWYSNGINTCRQPVATEAEAKAQAAAHVKGQIIKAAQV